MQVVGSTSNGDSPSSYTQAPSEQQPAQTYNENRMNVVLVGAECAPWSKTGIEDCVYGL